MDFKKIEKGLNNPGQAYNLLKLLLKGFYYKIKYRINGSIPNARRNGWIGKGHFITVYR